MKKSIIFIAMIFGMFLLMSNSGCDEKVEPTADIEQQRQTEMAADEGNRQVGMPAIVNFKEKKNLKLIYELCDQEDLICHAYLFNTMSGEVGQYLGQCLGYGIPYSTQFSNPMKVIDPDHLPGQSYYNGEGTPVVVPQPEPNLVFKPEGLSATWLMMIDPNTKKVRPVYVEPEIIVSPFKLK